MIGIVSYGLGNVRAIVAAYASVGVEASPARSPDELMRASKLVLPGVGSFDHALARLEELGFVEPLRRRVEHDGVPILGICLGMQLFAPSSDEGTRPGLGWIDGRVRSLESVGNEQRLAVPHMGWNHVRSVTRDGLFEGLGESRFYFLHSFYMECSRVSDVHAEVSYGPTFTCAVKRDNIYGVQFHPEKSHGFGVKLLNNFARS